MLFFKHAWWWFVAMLFFMFTVPLLPNSEWFAVRREIEVNRAFYGDASNSRFIQSAQLRFNRWFVDSGVYALSVKMTEPRKTKPGPARRGEFVDVEVSAFHTYVGQFWDGVLRALYRWEVNAHWYVVAVMSLILGVNEGLVRKQILPANAMYRSPAGFHLAGHFLVGKILGFLMVLPWLPVVMTWWLWVAAIIILTIFWSFAVLSTPLLRGQKLE